MGITSYDELKENIFADIVYLDILSTIAFCRIHRKGGGSAILIKKDLSVSAVLDVNAFPIKNIIELCNFHIKSVKIITVCRPPAGCFNTFIDQLDNVLVVGHFHVDFGSGTTESKELCDLFESLFN